MRCNIVIRIIIFMVILTSSQKTKADDEYILSVDPLLEATVTAGVYGLMEREKKLTNKMLETSAFSGSMTLLFYQMKEWENKYNSYLGTVQGFAEQIKGATTLYADAVITLRNLNDLKRMIESNPQGLVSSAVLNNLLIETADCLVLVFYQLNKSVAQGGDKNLLSGKERAEMIWQLVDRVEELNFKIRQLTYSVAVLSIQDVARYYLTRVGLNQGYRGVAETCLAKFKNSYVQSCVLGGISH